MVVSVDRAGVRRSPSSGCGPASRRPRDPGAARCAPVRSATPTMPRATMRPWSWPSSAPPPPAPASARRWAPDRRSGATSTSSSPSSTTGSSCARGRPPGPRLVNGLGLRPAVACRNRTERAAGRRRARSHRRSGAVGGPAGPAAGRARPSALGRGGRAMPRLRQLHPRLPHVLLHQRGRGLRPRRASRAARPAPGTAASAWASAAWPAMRTSGRRSRIATASG